MNRRGDSSIRRSPVRWWPAATVVGLMAVSLAWVWLIHDAGSLQSRVIPTFPILFFGTLLLFVWLVLFSRLPGRLRLGIFLCTAVVVGLGFLLFEIRAVDGNLVPILGFRWSAERQFEGGAAEAVDDALPGPADYAQFYGPGRRASLSGPALERDWSSRPPRELWRREVGEACSSFAVVGSAAVTFEQRGEQETVARYDLRTGRPVWVHSVHAPFVTTVGGSGPRGTPTIHEGRVYVLGATGNLKCLDLRTGEEVWSRNVLRDHDAGQPDWGLASSPLVVGELVTVQLGNQGRGLAAYHRNTGEPAWRAGEE